MFQRKNRQKWSKTYQKHLVTHIFWKFVAQKKQHKPPLFSRLQFVKNHQPNQLPTSEAVVRLILSYAITLPLRDLHRRLQIPLAGLPESLLFTRHRKSRSVCVLCVFFWICYYYLSFIVVFVYFFLVKSVETITS